MTLIIYIDHFNRWLGSTFLVLTALSNLMRPPTDKIASEWKPVYLMMEGGGKI